MLRRFILPVRMCDASEIPTGEWGGARDFRSAQSSLVPRSWLRRGTFIRTGMLFPTKNRLKGHL